MENGRIRGEIATAWILILFIFLETELNQRGQDIINKSRLNDHKHIPKVITYLHPDPGSNRLSNMGGYRSEHMLHTERSRVI